MTSEPRSSMGEEERRSLLNKIILKWDGVSEVAKAWKLTIALMANSFPRQI